MTKNNLKIYITRKELGLYSHEKMRKDFVFFQSVIPYIRFAVISGSILGMVIYYYNVNSLKYRYNYTSCLLQ